MVHPTLMVRRSSVLSSTPVGSLHLFANVPETRLLGEQSVQAHHGRRSTWPEECDCALLDRSGLPITAFFFQEGLICLINGLPIHLTKGGRHRIEKSNRL